MPTARTLWVINLKTYNKNILRLVITVILIVSFDYCFSRAGGGSAGGGSSGGIHEPIPWPIFLILIAIALVFSLVYSGILTLMLRKKKRKVLELTNQLEMTDKVWDFKAINKRVEEVFFKVQNAWEMRNQDLAKDCMSDKIYNLHKSQTDQMKNYGRKNVLDKIKIHQIAIYSMTDFADNSKDTFSAKIKASMIDYIIDEKTKEVLQGSTKGAESFEEIWVFVRQGDKWVLDFIDQEVTFGDIFRGKSYKA